MGYSPSRRKKAAEKKAWKEAIKKRLNKSINLVGVFIALNEEETVPRLAKSLKGFTNRNVLVDTGSTDKTVEVAKENGFEVLEELDMIEVKQGPYAGEDDKVRIILGKD